MNRFRPSPEYPEPLCVLQLSDSPDPRVRGPRRNAQQNRRVFIFGEAALMGDQLLNEYEDVQTLRPDWKQILDKYQVDYVVYNKGEPLANVLADEPDWKLVYSDDVAVIYVRGPHQP